MPVAVPKIVSKHVVQAHIAKKGPNTRRQTENSLDSISTTGEQLVTNVCPMKPTVHYVLRIVHEDASRSDNVKNFEARFGKVLPFLAPSDPLESD